MPTLEGRIEIEDIMEALDLEELPPNCRHKPSDTIVLDVEVDQSEIDMEASLEEPEIIRIEPDRRDLRDGLRALIGGDFTMASILLVRAFDECEADVKLIVEEECRAAARKAAA